MDSAPNPESNIPTHCPACGLALTVEGRFCGNCGHPLPVVITAEHLAAIARKQSAPIIAQPATPPSPSVTPATPEPTQSGINPPEESPRSVAVVTRRSRTVLGVAQDETPNVPQKTDLPDDLRPHTPSDPPPAPVVIPETPQVLATPTEISSATVHQPVRVANTHSTMMGLAFTPPTAPTSQSPSQPPPAITATTEAVSPSKHGPVRVANAHATMIGVVLNAAPTAQNAGPSPVPTTPQPSVPPPPRAQQQVEFSPSLQGGAPIPSAGISNRRLERPPMMGGSEPGIPAPTLPPGTLPNARKRSTKSKVPPIVYPIAGAGLLLAVALIVLITRGAQKPTPTALSARLEPGPNDSVLMVVTVPNASPGTKIRYEQQEQTVDAQRQARLNVTSLGARVGTIELPVSLISPNGSTEHRNVRFVRVFTVTPDLAALATPPARFKLRIAAIPGSRVRVNDRDIQLNPTTGLGELLSDPFQPLSTNDTERFESTYRISAVTPDQTTAEQVIPVNLPRLPLSIDRPANNHMTTSDRIVVRVRAAGASSVRVSESLATPTPSQTDVFTIVVPLPEPGNHRIEVVGYGRGVVPALASFEVQRVNSTDRAVINRFATTSSATLTQLVTQRAAVGSHIRVRGQVASAPQEYGGGYSFVLAVTDRQCPSNRCLFWVDTEPGNIPTAGSNVEVTGTLTPRRSWTPTDSTERRSDPVIHASVVE